MQQNIPISEWIINQACEEGKRLYISGYTNLKVSINISGIHFKQYDFLQKEKCDIIQGFYLSKPIPFSELVEYLEMWEPGMLSGK